MSDLDEQGRISDRKLAALVLLVEAFAAALPDENVSKAEFAVVCAELKRSLSVLELVALLRELNERREADRVN